MGFIKIKSAQIHGITAIGISVEIDISNGLFLFQIIGLANKAVEESRERVLSSIKNSFEINPKSENDKITVSLTPATIHKEGSYTDIAIALGYIIIKNNLNIDINEKVFIGELSLNGEVLPVIGIVPIILWAKSNKIKEIYIPKENFNDAKIIKGINIYLITSLKDLVSHLKQELLLEKVEFENRIKDNIEQDFDIGQIHGQEIAKRALIVAATGGHNIILYGPPGTGKTMLAKAFQSILPNLSDDEFLEVAQIYSSIGLFNKLSNKRPPIRSPHHSSSKSAILGGGSIIRPGEITLAHNGVLYLDEFLEFEKSVLESLRESLEEKRITISRSRGTMQFPAKYILLGSMNPCPCGYRGSRIKNCTCAPQDIYKYQKKISGPISDRIDIWVPVNNIDYKLLHKNFEEKESDKIKNIIKEIQIHQKSLRGKINNELSTKEISNTDNIDPSALQKLEEFAIKMKLSPRSYIRTLKVARTIADLEYSEKIKTPHIMESLQYRQRDF